jgi:hypothetical protein
MADLPNGLIGMTRRQTSPVRFSNYLAQIPIVAQGHELGVPQLSVEDRGKLVPGA